MTQPIHLACPQCRRDVPLGPNDHGQQVYCPHCQHQFEARVDGNQPLLNLLQQLEGLQRQLARTAPAPSATLPEPILATRQDAELEQLRRELDTARSERDRLLAWRDAVTRDATQLVSLVGEYTQAQAAANAARLTAFQVLVRTLDEAKTHWRDERQALQARAESHEQQLREAKERRQAELPQDSVRQGQPQHDELRIERDQLRHALEFAQQDFQRQQAALDDADTRLLAEKDRAEQERRQSQETLDELRRQHERERAAERQELLRLREEWDATTQRHEDLARERQVLSDQQQQLEAVHQEREQRWQAEVDSLRASLTQARQEQERAATARQQAQQQLESLRHQFDQERAALRQELAALRRQAPRPEPGGTDDRRRESSHVDAFWALEGSHAGFGVAFNELEATRRLAAPVSGNGPAAPGRSAAEVAAEVEQLVRRLGSDQLTEQTTASKQLEALGLTALPALANPAANPDLLTRRGAGRAYLCLGELCKKSGQRAQAQQAYLLAVPLFARLTADVTNDPEYAWRLADCHFNLGALCEKPARMAEAEEYYRHSLEITERLTAEYPVAPRYRRALAQTQNNLGIILAHTNRAAEAEQVLTQCLRHQEKLLAEHPTQALCKFDLALTYLNWGMLHAHTNRTDQAADAFRRAQELGENLAAKEPQSAVYRSILTTANDNLKTLLEKKPAPTTTNG